MVSDFFWLVRIDANPRDFHDSQKPMLLVFVTLFWLEASQNFFVTSLIQVSLSSLGKRAFKEKEKNFTQGEF
jgi:hypothetical protein